MKSVNFVDFCCLIVSQYMVKKCKKTWW